MSLAHACPAPYEQLTLGRQTLMLRTWYVASDVDTEMEWKQ